jgi:hypothetical protein
MGLNYVFKKYNRIKKKPFHKLHLKLVGETSKFHSQQDGEAPLILLPLNNVDGHPHEVVYLHEELSAF